MSESAEKKIAELETELRVAQELLFLVLDHIDEPVVLDIEEAKAKIHEDRVIDLDLNEQSGTWTLQVVSLGDAVE